MKKEKKYLFGSLVLLFIYIILGILLLTLKK